MARKQTRKSTKKWTKLPNPYHQAEKEWSQKATKTFNKLCANMKKSHNLNIIRKDFHDLLLLLGEWNYVARECKSIDKKIHKKAKQTPTRPRWKRK
jgi:hypothetical protein